MGQYRIERDIEKLSFEEWKRFNKENLHGSVYQSPEMYELFQQTEKFEPNIFVLLEGEDIKGLILAVTIFEYSGILKYLSSRTVIYGGPIIQDCKERDTILSELLAALVEGLKHKSVFIQFRNFFDWSKDFIIFRQHGFKWMDRLNYVVDTTDEKKTWDAISKSKRRQIKVALKSGARIIDPNSIEQVEEFYFILYDLYKNRVKKPLPDWSFFKSFYELSKKNKLGVIRLIEFNGQIIGGILSPVFTNKTVFEWYICGLDIEFKKQYPSVLATWAAMEYASKNKIETFDFMGVGVPNKDYGVREFKRKFGGEMTNFGRFGRINNKFVYLITEVGFNLLALLKRI